MLFYQFNGIVTDEKWLAENDDRHTFSARIRKIAKKNRQFNRRFGDKAFFFVADASDETVIAGAVTHESIDSVKPAADFFRAVELPVTDISVEEVTLDNIVGMLTNAKIRDYIKDDDEVLERFGLENLLGRRWDRLSFKEDLAEDRTKDEVFKTMSSYLVRDTFLPELERIYATRSAIKANGHPVHYMLQTDDADTRLTMTRTLLNALYSNGRLQSRRYCSIAITAGDDLPKDAWDCLYKSCIGGSVVIRYLDKADSEDDHASGSRDVVEMICELTRRYRNRVLTVLCLPRACERTKAIFYENLGNTCIMELREEFASGDRAKDFLKMLAKENSIRSDKKLFAMLDEGETYLAVDLRELFDEWYGSKLRTTIYPQYKELVTARKEAVKKASKGSAYDELSTMIGLSEAKKIIDRAISYYKAQKLFADKGMKADRPAMHMVFTGNPGTAKTTVARLFARIMQENDLLPKGRCVEVGRGDLVGKYVGWTAPIIQKKFKEAAGSVLFIDEAYSLVDGHDGSYGDEAINAIVQEMENHREDVVVIFAGYPDKMEQFLQKNPGLRSRIAFHVPFDDYTTDDLCGIARLIAKNKGLTLTEDALDKLKGVFEQARLQDDFGNGRYVRNAVEKARMAQAERLLLMDPDTVSRRAVATICAEDIEIPVETTVHKKTRIGFCA